MRVVSIWGREPAVWLSLIAAIVMVAGRLLHWQPEQQGVLNAAAAGLMGLVIAWMVGLKGDGMLAVILGAAKAILAVALAFRLHISADDQVLVMGVLEIVAAAFLRTQLTAPVGPGTAQKAVLQFKVDRPASSASRPNPES